MARLIELHPKQIVAGRLSIAVGDLLIVSAGGVHIRGGGSSVEFLGAFVSAAVGKTGDIVAPAGVPNVVALRAREAGTATIELLLPSPGLPSAKSERSTVEIMITE